MKDKIKKTSTKLIVMAIISLVFLLVMISENPEQNQYLNHIDYNVVMNNDGSMRVTETWDININKTKLWKNTVWKLSYDLKNPLILSAE